MTIACLLRNTLKAAELQVERGRGVSVERLRRGELLASLAARSRCSSLLVARLVRGAGRTGVLDATGRDRRSAGSSSRCCCVCIALGLLACVADRRGAGDRPGRSPPASRRSALGAAASCCSSLLVRSRASAPARRRGRRGPLRAGSGLLLRARSSPAGAGWRWPTSARTRAESRLHAAAGAAPVAGRAPAAS